MKPIKVLLLAGALLFSGVASAATYKKVVGGDISMLTKYYEAGKIYKDANGNTIATAPDFLAYLKAQGLNSMRVRLFVDPSQASSTHKGEGVCQDLDYVKALGKQIKDAGLNFLLDFHYSDTWTDPGQHSTPASWNSTNPTTLGNYLYNYTVDALTALKNAGAEPDDIQIGNEVTVGELWPTGKCYANGESVTTGSITGTMANFALYLKRSAEACRLVCPSSKIIIHTELGNSGWGAKTLYTTLKNYNVDYDIIGLSYYPYHHGSLSVLENVITSLESSQPDKPIQIVETGFYYRWGEGTVDYEISQAGQKQFTDDLISMLNSHSSVNGLYWWWLEANEWGTNTNVTTNWYYAGLWSNDDGKPCLALASLKNFINNDDNRAYDIKAYFINQIGWSTVYAYSNYYDTSETVYSAAWPGTTMTKTTEHVEGITGDVYQWNCNKTVTSIRQLPGQIQFNNSGWETGQQSDMRGFLNGAYYRFYQSGGSYVSECYKVMIPDGAGIKDHSTDFWCRKWVQPLNVGYNRTFTQNQPATVCLPFALTEEEVAAAGKFYILTAYNDGKLIFSPVTSTVAYTPYLFVAKADGQPFISLGSKEIDVTSLVSVSGGSATMTGTMERMSLASGNGQVIYGYKESDGTFVKVKTGNVNPFRAYITVPETAAGSNNLTVEFLEEDGVTNISTETAPSTQTYDLMGRKVAPDSKGIIISNGKKIWVK